jgi:hypothetical protein
MQRWDGIVKFMHNVHQQTAACDKAVLEVASFFIPMGWLTKLKYVKNGIEYLRWRRGVAGAAKVSEEVVEQAVVKQATEGGATIVGEGMKRVSMEAAKYPCSVILNNMPKLTGASHQVTSQMMTYNRQWLLQQMRSGRPIIDIGLDPLAVVRVPTNYSTVPIREYTNQCGGTFTTCLFFYCAH